MSVRSKLLPAKHVRPECASLAILLVTLTIFPARCIASPDLPEQVAFDHYISLWNATLFGVGSNTPSPLSGGKAIYNNIRELCPRPFTIHDLPGSEDDAILLLTNPPKLPKQL